MVKMKGGKMDTNREIIEEKDEKIAQLERHINRNKGSTTAKCCNYCVDHNSRSLSPPKGIFKSFLKVRGLKIILAILVFLVITSGGIWGYLRAVPSNKSLSRLLNKFKSYATLATAEAHMKVVLNEEDNKIFGKDISINLPGTKRELLLVVPATVIAGVDLKGITSKDMVINEETKEIDITLPHAKLIQDPSVQMDKIQTYDNGGLFRGDIKWDEGFDLAAKAQEQIRQEAISDGLLDTAEKSAEKVLKEFFKNIGYTVNVTFN